MYDSSCLPHVVEHNQYLKKEGHKEGKDHDSSSNEKNLYILTKIFSYQKRRIRET